jgi:hypothetical protein
VKINKINQWNRLKRQHRHHNNPHHHHPLIYHQHQIANLIASKLTIIFIMVKNEFRVEMNGIVGMVSV